MLKKIKNRIEREMEEYAGNLDKKSPLAILPPLLANHIRHLLLQDGKRIRPVLFIIGYSGFADKTPRGLYRSALSVELLHNFILVHDDIIDRSDYRRGVPSMHKMFDRYLIKYEHAKCAGPDLAMLLGDVMYAMGISSFLAIEEDATRKEAALKKLLGAAVYTGTGEFLELLYSAKDLSCITRDDIYKIYDLKTGIYSFVTPLAVGALLAGAKEPEAGRLSTCGVYLGRAFQLKDDIADILGDKTNSLKPPLTDLREAKRTMLIWYAFNNSGKENRSAIKKILGKGKATSADLSKVHRIIIRSGAIDYAKSEIPRFLEKAKTIIKESSMRRNYKDLLINYADNILAV